MKQNKKFNCVIIDDEPLSLEMISNYLSSVENVNIIGKYTNCVNAICHFDGSKDIKPDLLIIDIQMPVYNGLDFVEEYAFETPVIFITSYRDYVLKTFDFIVIDFIVKPIQKDRFLKAIYKAKQKKNSRDIKENNNKKENYFFIKTDKKILRLDFKEILFIESLKDYIKVVCKKDKYITYQNLNGISKYLPKNQFVRVHKSFIIAFDKISFIENNVINIDDNLIPIGKSYSGSINNLLINNLASKTKKSL